MTGSLLVAFAWLVGGVGRPGGCGDELAIVRSLPDASRERFSSGHAIWIAKGVRDGKGRLRRLILPATLVLECDERATVALFIEHLLQGQNARLPARWNDTMGKAVVLLWEDDAFWTDGIRNQRALLLTRGALANRTAVLRTLLRGGGMDADIAFALFAEPCEGVLDAVRDALAAESRPCKRFLSAAVLWKAHQIERDQVVKILREVPDSDEVTLPSEARSLTWDAVIGSGCVL